MKAKKNSKKDADLLEEPQKMLKKIGGRLKELRIKKGFTSYEDFAYEHDIDRSQYGKYERGAADIRVGTLVRLLGFHDLTMGEFFKDWDR